METLINNNENRNDNKDLYENGNIPCIRSNAVITETIKPQAQIKNNDLDDDKDQKSVVGTNVRDMTGDQIPRDMSMDKIRNRIQQIERDVMEKVSHQIKDMVSELLQELEQVQPEKDRNDLFDESTKYNNKKKSTKREVLPEKEFLMRNSPLNDLFKIKHIRTIYHIFIAALIVLFMNTVLYEIVDTGSTDFGLSIIISAFGKFNNVLYIWLGMMVSTFGVHVAFSTWANKRIHFSPKSIQLKIWDYFWLISLIVYQISFIILPAKLSTAEELPPASAMALLMEQIRLIMKTHAFVRSSAPHALNYKSHSDEISELPICPDFTKFLYFLFCPTLVYRNNYPRTKVIRWRVVIWNYTEVVLAIFYVAFLFERFIIPSFKQFGTNRLEPRSLVLNIFGTMMPGLLGLLCCFYCLLHSWMNAFAELLRFADRMFYKDWWTTTSYDAWYRTWNVVVHDWLYAYIYKDMYEIITRRNRTFSTFMVFLVSAIFHEYILAFTFRFFYPVLLINFAGSGMLFVFLTRKYEQPGGNIFIWFTLFTGSGTILSLYAMEFYARINCPPYKDQFLDLFIPRSWTCHRLSD